MRKHYKLAITASEEVQPTEAEVVEVITLLVNRKIDKLETARPKLGGYRVQVTSDTSKEG